MRLTDRSQWEEWIPMKPYRVFSPCFKISLQNRAIDALERIVGWQGRNLVCEYELGIAARLN
jgi:hypothetical protein